MTAFGVITYVLDPTLAESIYNGKATLKNVMDFFKVSQLAPSQKMDGIKHEIITFIARMELPSDNADSLAVSNPNQFKEKVEKLFFNTELVDENKKFGLASRAIGVLKLTGKQ